MSSNATPQLDGHVTDIILESISDGVFTVDHKWRITSFNRAAEKITGICRQDAIGKYCWEVFRSNMCEADCALRRTMKRGKSFVDSSTYIVNRQQRRVPLVVVTSLLKDAQGTVVGGVETFRDMSQVEQLRQELDDRRRVGDIISHSPLMHKIFTLLPQVAQSDCTVLIQGETGTGKELLARALHDLSPRRKRPFVAVNCGALPDTLLESELFGYKAGAFTHATRNKPGLFATAEGGTLLLDEIGDISPAFQVRLLRVLQERQIQPLGSTGPIPVNVRVLAATNRNLAEMAEQGAFRRDLFYRINVMRLDLPPLRQRREDIPLLVEVFIERLNLLRNKQVGGIRQDALALLMNYPFPGNIRELENFIEHAFVLCGDGLIEPGFLPEAVRRTIAPPPSHNSLDDACRATEAQMILTALKRHDFNRLAAARELGMHKSTLFRKIRRLGLTLPNTDGRHRI